MKKEKNNSLTPIDASTRYEGGRVPSLTINGFGCFKEAFEYKATTSEDSYLLIFCDFGEGFYFHNGKNGVIRQGQYMIVKESDGFAILFSQREEWSYKAGAIHDCQGV